MSMTAIICIATVVVLAWGSLVALLLWSHNSRLREAGERLGIHAYRWRSLRAGCSCWHYEDGTAICDKCAS